MLSHCYNYHSKREETKKEHIVSVNKQFENAYFLDFHFSNRARDLRMAFSEGITIH